MNNFGKISFILLLPLLAFTFQGKVNAQFSDAYDFRVAIENNDLGFCICEHRVTNSIENNE